MKNIKSQLFKLRDDLITIIMGHMKIHIKNNKFQN